MDNDNMDISFTEYNEDFLEESQLLTLPIEIIKNILSYVDDRTRSTVTVVCHLFYELICELERDQKPLDLCYTQIYDDDIYQSILSSRRQFCELIIDLKDCQSLDIIDRIVALAKKFGDRLKRVKFWTSKGPMDTNFNLMAIWKFIPNVEELILCYIAIDSDNFFPRNEQNLHKLRKLRLIFCSFDIKICGTKWLDTIPRDVLTDLIIHLNLTFNFPYEEFLNRQTKIKRLEIWDKELIPSFHLQLEHLTLQLEHLTWPKEDSRISANVAVILTQQKKLKYVDFWQMLIDDKIFDAVTELKDLKTLRMIINNVSCKSLKMLTRLRHLKVLRIDSRSITDGGHLLTLSMMKNMKLESLTLCFRWQKIPKEILIQICRNCSKLRHIRLEVSGSIQHLITLVEYFPNMKSIEMDFSREYFPIDVLQINYDGLRHENLKEIAITNITTSVVKNTQTLLKLCNSCPNLEKILLTNLTDVSVNDFEKLLTMHPKLTHLKLGVNSFEFDAILIMSGLITNLHHFRIDNVVIHRTPMYTLLECMELVQCLFEDTFSKIKLNWYNAGEAEIIMKRRTSQDWFSNFNRAKFMEKANFN